MRFFAALLRARHRLTRLALVAAIVGGAYGFIVSGETLGGAVRGAMTGLVVALPIMVFEIFWRVGGAAKLSFGVGLLVRSAARLGADSGAHGWGRSAAG